MEPLGAIREHLDMAGDPAAVLAAGWNAFELIQQAAFAQARHSSVSYATWMSVIPPACEGRDALGRAPSVQHDSDRQPVLVTAEIGTDDETADALAALAGLLARRLQTASAHSGASGDQQAFQCGAAAAEEIAGLLAAGR